MQILKTVFHEMIGARIVDSFANWLMSKGYKEEGNEILAALAIWAGKESKRLKFCRSR